MINIALFNKSEGMPVQEFASDSAGTERVQIFQESSGEGVTYILLNHAVVGSISHREELRAGKAVILQNGSVLFIQQTPEGCRVMRDGQPLRLVSPAEREIAQKRALAQQRRERLRLWLPRIIGIGLVLSIVGYLLFASQSASSLPSVSQPVSYSIVLSRDQITPDRLNIIATRGENITWTIEVSDGIPGYWASDTGLILTLGGIASPLTVLAPQANTWDKDGVVTFTHGEQQTTMTSTLTIPSTIGGPKQRSLSGTLAGRIVYPVADPFGNPAFPTYEDQTVTVAIPVHLQLVS